MSLIWFEIRGWLKNPVFWAALLIICLFAGSQLGEGAFTNDLFTWPKPPEAGLVATAVNPAPYGWKQEQSDMALMRNTARMIYLAAHENPVTAPALGGFINRQVKLSDSQIQEVRRAFLDITGISYDQTDYYDEFPIALPYPNFLARLDILNEALGKILFSLDSYNDVAYVPATYEDSKDTYDTLLQEDHVTRAYARYYSDYMGIALALFPAFLAAFMIGKDKRSGAGQLIGARSITGTSYLFIKYLGLALPLCGFILLAGCIPTIGALMMRFEGHDVDVLAYLSLSVTWLMPTALVVTACALFLSVATGSGIVALPVALGWWMLSIARPGLAGPYPLFVSMIRFNSTDPMPVAWVGQIAANRLFVVGMSVLLVFCAGLLYERKRTRGGGYV